VVNGMGYGHTVNSFLHVLLLTNGNAWHFERFGRATRGISKGVVDSPTGR
jgi:hypothetical protein